MKNPCKEERYLCSNIYSSIQKILLGSRFRLDSSNVLTFYLDNKTAFIIDPSGLKVTIYQLATIDQCDLAHENTKIYKKLIDF